MSSVFGRGRGFPVTSSVLRKSFNRPGIALFVLRRKQPGLSRPYRCWGYPVVPLLFVVCTIALAANTLREQPKETFAGIGILLLGLPVYLVMRRRARGTA